MNKFMKLGTALVVLAALAGCGGPYQLTPNEVNTANLGALQYANLDGSKVLSCSGQDSDKDGYVTCTLKAGDKDKAILCSYNTTPGCKPKG